MAVVHYRWPPQFGQEIRITYRERRALELEREQTLSLASNLEAAWNAATTAMTSKQRLVRTLIQEIIVDVDEESREIILVIHCRGGHHSEHR